MSEITRSAMELGNEFLAKQKAAMEFFESKRGDDGQIRMTDADVERHNAELRELNELKDRHLKAIETEQLLKATSEYAQSMNRVANPDVVPAGRRDADTPVVKTLRQIIEGNESYRRGRESKEFGRYTIELPELKTAMTTAAGYAPQPLRDGIVVPYANIAPTIEDIIPAYDTDQSAVKFMEETTSTNSNAGISENAAASEGAHAFTERTSSIENVGEILPITEQQLEDVPAVEAMISTVLADANRRKRSYYIINGTGSSPQIYGFLNVSGIQTQAKGTDSAPDAVYKGIVKVNTTGAANASDVVMNHTDWQNIRLLTTTDGVYIYGSPMDMSAPRLWGLPVTLESNLSAGTAIVGDFRTYAQIANRKGVTVDFGRNSDDYAKFRFTARVSSRFGLVVRRAAAFCTITSL